MEKWKSIPGYEGLYLVSDMGQVKSIIAYTRIINRYGHEIKIYKGEKILKQLTKRRGYVAVNLYSNGKMRTIAVHKLVALAFLSNKEGYDQVNHLDADKKNNSVSNLQWCNQLQNMEHAKVNKLVKAPAGKDHYKSVKILNTLENKYYTSISEAAKENGLNKDILSAMLRGRLKNTTNFVKA